MSGTDSAVAGRATRLLPPAKRANEGFSGCILFLSFNYNRAVTRYKNIIQAIQNSGKNRISSS
jgi:hypothetical protein